MNNLARILTGLLTLTALTIFVLVAIPKILFPYEMHWMEGSMVTQIGRVMAGKPLYCQPTIYYVPWLYEPLYYYVSALFASVAGLSFQVARIPSVLSTIGILALIFWVVKKETGKMYYAFAAIGLYIAAYGKVEFSFVMARIDPLFNLLLVSSFIAVYYAKNSVHLLIASLLLALAYFTKQTGLVFAPTIIIYLWRYRSWKQAGIFAIGLTALVFGGVILLDKLYEGWFTYYTLFVPKGKGKTVRWEYAISGTLFFVIGRCWLMMTLLCYVPVKAFFVKRINASENASTYFGLFFITSLCAGFLGILNMGGGHNVLLPVAAASSICLPIIISKALEKKRYSSLAAWAIPIQLALLISNPWKDPRNIAQDIDKKNQEDFFAKVSNLPGNIWIPYHGYTGKYTGKTEYAELNALRDVLLVDDTNSHLLQSELDSSLSVKKWSYIFSELPDTIANYSMTGTMLNLNKVRMNDDTALYIYQPK
jgi:hypothetical protein